MPHNEDPAKQNMGMGPSILDDYAADQEEGVDDAELAALLGSHAMESYGEDMGTVTPEEGLPGAPLGTAEPSGKATDPDAIKAASFDLLKRSQERAERSKWFQSKASDMQNRKL